VTATVHNEHIIRRGAVTSEFKRVDLVVLVDTRNAQLDVLSLDDIRVVRSL
jgi:hypothetical protein